LRAYFDRADVREAFGLDPAQRVSIPSFHPVFRVAEDGSLRTEMVVEVIQERETLFDRAAPDLGSFVVRGGLTVIIGKPSAADMRSWQAANPGQAFVPWGNVRYAISKDIRGAAGQAREVRQRATYQRLGLVEGTGDDRFMIDFAITHGGG